MPKIPTLPGIEGLSLPYETRIYQFDQEHIYFIQAEGLGASEIAELQEELEEHKIAGIVCNFTDRKSDV